MKDQIHIRNAEAAHLARALARQTGKTVANVVLDALRRYRNSGPTLLRARVSDWRKLLAADRRQKRRKGIPLASLYDEKDGLAK